MKVKTALVLSRLDVNGRVSIKMDRASGLTNVVVTKRGDHYVVGRTPGSQLTQFTHEEVVRFLQVNSLYVISWS